jgi:hypothetical protein
VVGGWWLVFFVVKEAVAPLAPGRGEGLGVRGEMPPPVSLCFAGTFVKCLQRATCGTSHSTVPFFASSRLRVRLRTGERWWSAWLLWGRFRVSCPLTPGPSPPLGARGGFSVFSCQFSVAGRWLVVGFF